MCLSVPEATILRVPAMCSAMLGKLRVSMHLPLMIWMFRNLFLLFLKKRYNIFDNDFGGAHRKKNHRICSTAEFGTTCHLNGICGPSGSCLCNDLWEGHGWHWMGMGYHGMRYHAEHIGHKCIHLQSFTQAITIHDRITKLSCWHFPHFCTTRSPR